MPRFGYTLFSELNGPQQLVAQAVAAEEAGFDFAAISDHFHPWLESHTDSPFAWSVLGAAAARTERLGLLTMVTCPFLRYHPAVIAQAAATIAMLSDGRFTLGLGAGERLNEHVVGRGWPAVDVRHEMLVESLEAMRQLWRGGYCTYRGRHITVEDARLYSLPDVPPPVAVAASGQQSVALAAEHGDGLIAVEPDPDLVSTYRSQAGQNARAIGQVPLSFDRDEAAARRMAMRFSFGVAGWKMMSELPNPVNFDAAASMVSEDDVLEMVGHGPDPRRHLGAIQQFVDAGFDDIAVVQIGDDKQGFFDFWRTELAPRLT